MTKYCEVLEHLYSINRFSGMKLGLANIEMLLLAMGNPQRKVPVIHVAGTNGKGSTATKIAAALQEAGFKVGLFTSPHISSFRERIRLNGKMISEEKVAHYLEKIFAVEQNATYFEYVTAVMFAYFEEEMIDFAVVEVGLGGRFDATNVCCPVRSVITSISLDHVSVLGDTIDAITKEKAGIIKEGIPVIIGPQVDALAIQKIAEPLHAPLLVVDAKSTHFEEENNAIARTLLESLSIPTAAIEKGLQALPPCRFEIVSADKLGKFTIHPKVVVLDVAHNPDGIEKLFSRLKIVYKNMPLYIVYGASNDKDTESCLKIILSRASRVYFIESQNTRAAKNTELQKIASTLSSKVYCESVQSIEKPFLDASKGEGCLVVCGTFFIMGQARMFLGYDEPRDFLDLNEQSLGTRKGIVQDAVF